jgi:hypothetical protein
MLCVFYKREYAKYGRKEKERKDNNRSSGHPDSMKQPDLTLKCAELQTFVKTQKGIEQGQKTPHVCALQFYYKKLATL